MCFYAPAHYEKEKAREKDVTVDKRSQDTVIRAVSEKIFVLFLLTF